MKPQTAIVQQGLDAGYKPREVAAMQLTEFVRAIAKYPDRMDLNQGALEVVDALIVAATEGT